jgi:hypothetical protein
MARSRSSFDLPIYPRAFIAAAKLQRERDRVFVAMPFEANHSKTLWKLIQSTCEIHELVPRRGDSNQAAHSIVADVLEELETAQIVLADLTGLNPNVLYELGIAHVRCDSVVLLCQRGQALPFDLASIRCLFYDLSTALGREELAVSLGRILEELRQPGKPTIIDGSTERTQSVIADLRLLADLPDDELRNEVIWYSGFLSSFSVGEEGGSSPTGTGYLEARLLEREWLLKLARRGCSIRCVITPPSKDNLLPDRVSYALERVRALLAFLESDEPALPHIEFVISPFLQKNFYIIGRLCFSEGFRIGLESGYPLTLRQSDPDAINSSTLLHRALFERLRDYTLMQYPPGRSSSNSHENLRLATIRCLQESLAFCEDELRKTLAGEAGPRRTPKALRATKGS